MQITVGMNYELMVYINICIEQNVDYTYPI